MLLVLNPAEMSAREHASLRDAGHDPEDYVLINAPVMKIDCGAQQTPQGVLLIFEVSAIVPHAVLPAPLRGPLDAQGRPAMVSWSQKVFPRDVPPRLHLIVRRDLLGTETQERLDRARAINGVHSFLAPYLIPAGGAPTPPPGVVDVTDTEIDALEAEARKDDFGSLVPSDVRRLIGALRRARARAVREEGSDTDTDTDGEKA